MKRFSSSRSLRRFFGIAPGALDAAAHAHSSRINRRLITKLMRDGSPLVLDLPYSLDGNAG